jgi:hypothetical protein
MELMVLNCCVTETKAMPRASKASTILAKSASARVSPIDLVHHHGIELAGRDVGEQALQRGALIHSQRQEGWRVIDAHYDNGGYSGATLEGHTRFALGGERVERLFEPFFARFARVDRAAQRPLALREHRPWLSQSRKR